MRPEFIPTYALYGEPADGISDFHLHCETIASRSQRFSWEIKPHRHRTFFQILYFRNGNGDAIFGETEHRIRPQTIVTVPPETVHGFRFSHDMDGFVLTCVSDRLPVGNAPWRIRLAGLDRPNMFYGSAEETAHPPADRHSLCQHHDVAPDHWSFLVPTLETIEAELGAGFTKGLDLVDSCLASTLILLARITGVSQLSGVASRDMQRLNQLNALIGLHFRQHQPVSFYASRIGVSEHHLNRITRAATQHTVSRLLLNRLMDEARRDLLFTAMSVQQIAFELGYSDQAYFSRLFSENHGISPKDYRTRERSKLLEN